MTALATVNLGDNSINNLSPSGIREFRLDGTSWQRLWQHAGREPLTDETWTTVTYNLSPLADGKPEVRLRWGYQILDATRPYCGWHFDDILLRGRPKRVVLRLSQSGG